MASYLSDNEAKNLQNGDVHLARIPDFEETKSEGEKVVICLQDK